MAGSLFIPPKHTVPDPPHSSGSCLIPPVTVRQAGVGTSSDRPTKLHRPQQTPRKNAQCTDSQAMADCNCFQAARLTTKAPRYRQHDARQDGVCCICPHSWQQYTSATTTQLYTSLRSRKTQNAHVTSRIAGASRTDHPAIGLHGTSRAAPAHHQNSIPLDRTVSKILPASGCLKGLQRHKATTASKRNTAATNAGPPVSGEPCIARTWCTISEERLIAYVGDEDRQRVHHVRRSLQHACKVPTQPRGQVVRCNQKPLYNHSL